jgi:hypothetical protein
VKEPINREWMKLIKQTPCVLCARQGYETSPSHAHHMKYGTGAAGAGRSDFLTMPLCEQHHDNHPGSLHVLRERGLVLRYKCTEVELLADGIQGALAILRARGRF